METGPAALTVGIVAALCWPWVVLTEGWVEGLTTSQMS